MGQNPCQIARLWYNSNANHAWGRGSVGRAMRSQRIGQGFESPRLHHKTRTEIRVFSFERGSSHLLLTRICVLRELCTQNRCHKCRYSVAPLLTNPLVSTTKRNEGRILRPFCMPRISVTYALVCSLILSLTRTQPTSPHCVCIKVFVFFDIHFPPKDPNRNSGLFF